MGSFRIFCCFFIFDGAGGARFVCAADCEMKLGEVFHGDYGMHGGTSIRGREIGAAARHSSAYRFDSGRFIEIQVRLVIFAVRETIKHRKGADGSSVRWVTK